MEAFSSGGLCSDAFAAGFGDSSVVMWLHRSDAVAFESTTSMP